MKNLLLVVTSIIQSIVALDHDLCSIYIQQADQENFKLKLIDCPKNRYANSSYYLGKLCDEGYLRGQADENDIENYCNKCHPEYKMIIKNNAIKECDRCDGFSSAIDLFLGHTKTSCDIRNSELYNEDENLEKEALDLTCHESIKESKNNGFSFSIMDYICSCQENRPIGNVNGEIKCLEPDIIEKIFTDQLLNYIVIYKIQVDDDTISFINCDPYDFQRKIDNDYHCLCPIGYVFIDKTCYKCSDQSSSKSNKLIQCPRCPVGKIIGPDGVHCICPYTTKPIDNECNLCSEEQLKSEPESCFCQGDLVLMGGECRYCQNDEIYSKEKGICVCPFSEYPKDEYCGACNIKISNSDTCFCRENSIFKNGKCEKCTGNNITSEDRSHCICPDSNSPLDDNCDPCVISDRNKLSCSCRGNKSFIDGECKECPDSSIFSKNGKSCICSAGTIYKNSNECKYCSKGSFRPLNTPNKCIKCSFFKTTEKEGSTSPDDCIKFRVSVVIFLLVILLIICTLISLIVFVVYKTIKLINKPCSNNQNQAGTTLRDNRQANTKNKNNSKEKSIERKNNDKNNNQRPNELYADTLELNRGHHALATNPNEYLDEQ